jgi:hypothetical protein
LEGEFVDVSFVVDTNACLLLLALFLVATAVASSAALVELLVESSTAAPEVEMELTSAAASTTTTTASEEVAENIVKVHVHLLSLLLPTSIEQTLLAILIIDLTLLWVH